MSLLIKIGDTIFAYSIPISAIGSIMFSIIALASLNMADVIANKTMSIIINLIVGIAGMVVLGYWLNRDIPVIGDIIRTSITTVGYNNPPKDRL